MSKFVKPQSDEHIATLRSDGNLGELIVVSSGRRAYLWAGSDDGHDCVTFSGQQTLRKLARIILKEIPERKSK